MKNIQLIKASAGSGKTYSLMERLAAATLRRGIKPSEFLVTTFTCKAAAELQGRIRARFLKEKRDDLANQMDDGIIGTVNSVCAALLNEYALFAGLSPTLDVIPEERGEIVFRNATAKILDKKAKNILPLAIRLSLDPNQKSSGQNKDSWGKTPDWQSEVKKIVDCARRDCISSVHLRECGERCAEDLANVFVGSSDCTLESLDRACAFFYNLPDEVRESLSVAALKIVDAANKFHRFPTWHNALSFAGKSFAKKDAKILPPEQISAYSEWTDRIVTSRTLLSDLREMTKFLFDCAADMLDAYTDYKKQYGLLDFIDQETNVLSLASENNEFGTRITERVKQFMVDEFQDTSPVQMALFLAIHRFVDANEKGETIWVGDSKQSIYGFRGADSELMATVEGELDAKEILPHSYRSKENLVRFANEIFTRVFTKKKPEEVRLSVPPDRRESARGGKISSWLLRDKNNTLQTEALAKQVALMIHRGVKPKDIAVLCRTGDQCNATVKALGTLNIQSSGSAESLIHSTECRLAMTAYRFALDRFNLLSAAEFAALSEKSADVLSRLLAVKAAQGENEASNVGNKTADAAAALTRLNELRPAANETVPELLDRVILSLGLDERVERMPFPVARRSNLDALRKAATVYIEAARLQKIAATLTGFPIWLESADSKTGVGKGDDVVNVLTYHGAKGLEWPVVILTQLDAPLKYSLFQANNISTGEMNPNDPCNHRAVHYWPYPFHPLRTQPAILQNALSNHPLDIKFRESAREEESRLLYVGLTRAKEHLIFAHNFKNGELNCSWLETVSPSSGPLFNWPTEDGVVSDWKIAGSEENFELETRVLIAEQMKKVEMPPAPVYADRLPKDEPFTRYPAFLAPSQADESVGQAALVDQWEVAPPTGRLVWNEDVFARFGSAFHEYAALRPRRDSLSAAERILSNWSLDIAFASTLQGASERFYAWAENAYPSGEIACEMPMTLVNENGQRYQGYIDLLIETPAGYVIIDHKTHNIRTGDADALAAQAEDYAARQAAQLRIYRQAVEKATGKSVLDTLIHLPLLGRVYRVTTDR